MIVSISVEHNGTVSGALPHMAAQLVRRFKKAFRQGAAKPERSFQRMVPSSIYRKYYGPPGDPRYDGTLAFFSLVRQNACSDFRVLNLGAGPRTDNPRCIQKGEFSEIIGADIDPVVLSNPEVDLAVVIENGKLPFSDNYFDLAFSDYVLEHVERPVEFLIEVHRVLKKGASYFFRTPNVYHYVIIASMLTPHWIHKAIANPLRELPTNAHEPWFTYYRMNSRRAILKAAQAAGFQTIDLQMAEYQPSYLVFHTIPFLAGVAYERLVNSTERLSGLRANIFGRITK
jgi:SAM-dependent methyltransferase